jgi:hypothetical protein
MRLFDVLPYTSMRVDTESVAALDKVMLPAPEALIDKAVMVVLT